MTAAIEPGAEGRLQGLRDALATCWTLLREDPARGVGGALMIFSGAISGPLLGLALAALVGAGAEGRFGAAALAGCWVAVLAVIQLTMGHFTTMVFGVLGERAILATTARLVRATQDGTTLDRQEDPEFADEMSLLRQDVFALHYVVQGLLETLAVVVQMLVTVVLLGRLQPLLMFLPLAALAPYFAGRHATELVERTRKEVEPEQRKAHDLLTLTQQPGPMMEIRLAGLSLELARRQGELINGVAARTRRAEAVAALVRTAGQVVFGAAYGLALLLVVRDAVAGHSGAADVVLAIVLARQVAVGVTQILSLTLDMQRAGKIGARMRRVLGAAREDAAMTGGTGAAPQALRDGIRLEGVSFRYPGTTRDVVSGLDLALPAGSVVALVGENGAGKSTLVKLLCGLYRPSAGRVLIDGRDLAELDAQAWRDVTSAAFQDFVRFEFPVQQVVGIGDLPSAEDAAAARRALRDAGAEGVLTELPDGLETRIGTSFPDGRDLSGGQWQKLALGRAMMRRSTVLMVLDEPTAALDAQSEHLLFERHLESARRAAEARGAIALFVSHRFSTVSMADRIVVLDDGSVTEQGTHAELMSAGGRYASLFDLQARGYRS
ncbi:ABC transporter ATP-binding protein [Peterkaempfera sp. SMS 1(5)a]|uniref:ABC transporter ATP-binding protein n=1 Tax=Peterkaempfera podocarpi TaxID=3232308 RepID=UPI00366DDBE0